MLYNLETITIPQRANPRFADASTSERRRAETNGHGFARVIGGDMGDLLFDGYSVDGDETTVEFTLRTTMPKLTNEEAQGIGQTILDEAMASIGLEAIGSD